MKRVLPVIGRDASAKALTLNLGGSMQIPPMTPMTPIPPTTVRERAE